MLNPLDRKRKFLKQEPIEVKEFHQGIQSVGSFETYKNQVRITLVGPDSGKALTAVEEVLLSVVAMLRRTFIRLWVELTTIINSKCQLACLSNMMRIIFNNKMKAIKVRAQFSEILKTK